MTMPLVETKNLKKYFKTDVGMLHAVENVNLRIMPGKTLGVVGESGCGKSTLGRTILRLQPATDGEVLYNGDNILKYKGKDMKKIHLNMQMVFQDPYSSLDPRMSVHNLIAEPVRVCGLLKSKAEINEHVREIMNMCGLPADQANLYPHELDGGLRQRVGLGRVHSGADSEPSDGFAGAAESFLYVHHPRSVRGKAYQRRNHGHVYGTGSGACKDGGAVRQPRTSLYEGAASCGAYHRPVPAKQGGICAAR